MENPLHSQILKTDQLQNTKLMNAYHPSASGNRRDAGSDAAQPSSSGSISGQDHTSDSQYREETRGRSAQTVQRGQHRNASSVDAGKRNHCGNSTGYFVTIIVYHGLLNARGCYLIAHIQLRGSHYSMSGYYNGQKDTKQITTSILCVEIGANKKKALQYLVDYRSWLQLHGTLPAAAYKECDTPDMPECQPDG